MSRSFTLLVRAGIIAATMLGATWSHAQTVLKYSNWLPAGQAMRVEVIEPWIAEVEKVTNGRVKIETLPKVIGSVQGQYDVARDGQADIVVFINGYTPGRFDVSEVLELPFMGDNPELYAPIVDRFYRKHLVQYGEYKGLHPLSVYVVSPGQFFNNQRPIKALEDFKGLKIRSPQAGATAALTLLGAVPVAKPASEAYELLSSGVLDGTMMPPESIMAFKLMDKLPYATIIPGAMFNSVLTLAINEGKWTSLRQEDRDAIMRISGDVFAGKIGRTYNKGDQATWEAMRKAGKSVEVAGPALVADIQRTLEPIEAAWVEKARKKGVAEPKKLLEALRAEIAAAKRK